MKQIGEIIQQLPTALSHQEQVPTAWKPSAIGAELQAALTETKICRLNDTEPVFQALRYAMLLVGLRAKNLPNDQERAVLLMHIRKNYGGHTSAEIRLAFEMAISGKLDLDQSEVVCYENFSCLYFSGIMNAYRKWAAEQVRQDTSANIVEQTNPMTDEQLMNYRRQRTEEFYQRIKRGQPEPIPTIAIDVLLADGLIEKQEDAANFFVTKLNNNAQNIYVKSE